MVNWPIRKAHSFDIGFSFWTRLPFNLLRKTQEPPKVNEPRHFYCFLTKKLHQLTDGLVQWQLWGLLRQSKKWCCKATGTLLQATHIQLILHHKNALFSPFPYVKKHWKKEKEMKFVPRLEWLWDWKIYTYICKIGVDDEESTCQLCCTAKCFGRFVTLSHNT